MQRSPGASGFASFSVAFSIAPIFLSILLANKLTFRSIVLIKSRYILGISVKNRGKNFVYSCQNPLPKRFLAVYRQFFNCRQCSCSLVALKPSCNRAIVAVILHYNRTLEPLLLPYNHTVDKVWSRCRRLRVALYWGFNGSIAPL